MSSIYGSWPDSQVVRRMQWRLTIIHLSLAVLVSATLFPAAHAQPQVPLTLAEAEDIALLNEPGQAAMLAHAAALLEQSVAAGQLPDPKLKLGLANYPINGGNFTTEGMTQGKIGVRQAFPRGKSLSLSTARLRARALGQSEGAAARARDVLVATRVSWLEAYYWQRARQILIEARPLFNDLLTITRSMYSVGRKTQYDVLRAELELSRLEDRLIVADRSRATAQAALSQWLGNEAYRPAALKLPAWDKLPLLEILQQNLDSHPSLQAAAAAVVAQQAAVGLAREARKPGWALDLGYGYRDGYLPNGEPRSDFVSLSVTVDLPIFKKNRQDRKLAAALSERRAAISGKDRLAAQLKSKLDSEYARWTEQTRRLQLYEAEILRLTENQAEAAMLAYKSDAGDFADVMRGYIDNLNTRLDYIRLQVERAQGYAVLANLGGLPR